MKRLVVIAVLLAVPMFGQTSRGDAFRNKQAKIINQYAKELVKMGRMPEDYNFKESILGQFGWHSVSYSETGAHPSPKILQRGEAFGAYTFSNAAFEQAKRSWWINAVIMPDSNILVATNKNAEFDESVIGYTVKFYALDEPAKVIGLFTYKDGSKSTSMLVLDKRSRKSEYSGVPFLMYGLGVLPPDYVDMCECKM